MYPFLVTRIRSPWLKILRAFPFLDRMMLRLAARAVFHVHTCIISWKDAVGYFAKSSNGPYEIDSLYCDVVAQQKYVLVAESQGWWFVIPEVSLEAGLDAGGWSPPTNFRACIVPTTRTV